MIKNISIEEAEKFYISVRAKDRKQLYFPNHGSFYGYFNSKGELKGIACIISFKNKNRITCFLIDKDNRNKGYGNSLLKKILKENSNKPMTAYTTVNSKKIFEKNGFKILKEQKYDITFMECEPNEKL